jgi:hypothetical protein
MQTKIFTDCSICRQEFLAPTQYEDNNIYRLLSMRTIIHNF